MKFLAKKQVVKITLLIFSLPAVIYFSAPAPAGAAGLVPCGGAPPEKACTVCDFFVLIKNITDFVAAISVSLILIVAVYIAFLFFISGGSSAKITDAKSKAWLAVKGLIIILLAWLIVSAVLNVVADSSVFPWPWNKINCG